MLTISEEISGDEQGSMLQKHILSEKNFGTLFHPQTVDIFRPTATYIN
jgi:hypothetical protein